jgi:hypothetical protein
MIPATPLSPVAVAEGTLRDHSFDHALSWPAIIAGSFVIAALGLILLTLGFGLGLSSISPWAYRGVSGKTIAEGAIAWLVLSQILASGLGGYLAGRLRQRWVRVHLDEVHFRDTAQGFLAWALAVVVTAGFLASAGTAMVGGPATADAYHSRARIAAPLAPVPGSTTVSPMAAEEGLNGNDAATIEANRKAAAYGALWLFIALLGGAFSASLFATVGGRHRDHMFVYVG